MKNIKITALTLLLLIGFIIPSCNDDGIDCSGCENSVYFDVEGLNVDLLASDVEGSKLINANDTLLFTELDMVHIDYEVDYHASALPAFDWSFSLMNTANACTCIPGGGGSKTEKLVALSITSLYDFDADHPAGSEINDLFDYYGNYFEEFNEGRALETVVAEANGQLLESEDWLLRLRKAPEMDTDFQIKISLELSTGEKYEVESLPIYLKP